MNLTEHEKQILLGLISTSEELGDDYKDGGVWVWRVLQELEAYALTEIECKAAIFSLSNKGLIGIIDDEETGTTLDWMIFITETGLKDLINYAFS